MVELSHDLDLLNQALPSILLTVGCFFGEGLHCVFLLVGKFLHQVHRREVPFSDLLDRLECLMEALLV